MWHFLFILVKGWAGFMSGIPSVWLLLNMRSFYSISPNRGASCVQLIQVFAIFRNYARTICQCITKHIWWCCGPERRAVWIIIACECALCECWKMNEAHREIFLFSPFFPKHRWACASNIEEASGTVCLLATNHSSASNLLAQPATLFINLICLPIWP